VGAPDHPARDAEISAPETEKTTTISFATSFVVRQTWIYGIGVASAALVVLAAGLMLVRRKTSGNPLP
jgi:hypothetical protein